MTNHRVTPSSLLIVALLAPGVILAQPAAPQAAPAPEAQAGAMLFVENAGQWPAAAGFQVWGGPGTIWLAEDAIWITLVEKGQRSEVTRSRSGAEWRDQRPEVSTDPAAGFQPPTDDTPRHGVNLTLTFSGANPQSTLEPSMPVETKVNYCLGNDPDQWLPEVPVWGSVRYNELYPGVDLVLGDGAAGAIPWRLEAQPGADLSAVRLRVEGADSVALDGRLLRIVSTAGESVLPLPAAEFSFQVEARTTDGRLLSFDAAPGEVAGRQPVDISRYTPEDNPADLLYSTFLGGTGHDWGKALAVDGAGSAYVTGYTSSSDFPTTPGAFDTSYNGGSTDAFVTKLNYIQSASETSDEPSVPEAEVWRPRASSSHSA